MFLSKLPAVHKDLLTSRGRVQDFKEWPPELLAYISAVACGIESVLGI